jgi:membrane protein DedA with SNARE-associated domain
MADIGQVIHNLEPLIRDYGVVAVTVVLTFESFGVPLPGESLLIVASVLAGRGVLSFPSLLFFAWVGAVVGDNIGYVIGRLLGRTIMLRHGKKIGLNAERLRKVEDVFARYGPVAVAFARFINILRQLNGVVAGTLNMDWRWFLIANAAGGALWVLVWGFAGFYLGEHLSSIITFASNLGGIGAIVILAVLLFVLLYTARGRRRE